MLEKYGIECSELQKSQFEKYYELLIEYNEHTNLTSIVKKDEVYLKHFYDSLLTSNIIELTDQSFLDVGSGAGFPSIPLKIMYPNLKVTIVDSLGKRIEFLKHLTKELGVEVVLVNMRAEDYIENQREKFDIVSARAVARLNILAELCLGFLKIDGHFIVLKGQNAKEEIEEAKSAVHLMGAKLEKIEEYQLPNDLGKRYMVDYLKIKKTKKIYPRSFAKIKKNPL